MKPFMPSFLLFPMAMGVNGHQNKYNDAGSNHHDEKRAILPQQRNKRANI